MPEIISRLEAKAAGLKRYFTGEPCKHGHVVERNTNTGRCIDCLKNDMIAWRASNPKKAKEIDNRSKKSRYAANPEKYREIGRTKKAKQWAASPEKAREREREKGRKWRAANVEKWREQCRRAQLVHSQKKRDAQKDQRVAQVLDAYNQSVNSLTESGAILDQRTAIDIFKSQFNAFDFELIE